MWMTVSGMKCLVMSLHLLNRRFCSCCYFFRSGKFWRRSATVTFCRALSCSSLVSQIQRRCLLSSLFRPRRNCLPSIMISSISSTGHQMCLRLLSKGRNLSFRLSVTSCEMVSKISWSVKRADRQKRNTSASLIFGLCASFASEPANAEVSKRPETEVVEEDEYDLSSTTSSHGKRVYFDYSITGIPGDGRCLFRSVVHGARLRSGNISPDESLQKKLADELRSRVADEFVKRREDTEWFVEGDFDTYVSRMRRPHVWGGEPELFMASHVLQMPITVYMHDEGAGGLIAIAEYGQEYGKENPIRVLYDGYSHYDALQIPGKNSAKPRL